MQDLAFNNASHETITVMNIHMCNIVYVHEPSVLNTMSYQLFDVTVQEGKVAIKRVANLLLCIYAGDTVGLGLLKAKVRCVKLNYSMYKEIDSIPLLF